MHGPNDVMALFAEICDATADALAGNADWGPSGLRAGQYAVDLVLDAICVEALLGAGYAVLSEESGLQGDPAERGTVVVDPLDGSTNASLGLPWCATSLCLAVEGTAMASMVANLVTGTRFGAVRGGGASRDGQPLSLLSPMSPEAAIVAVSGYPPRDAGWRQFRTMGAAALDLCAVADGSFAAYVDMNDAHGAWDYLGGQLVVEEAGGVVVDAAGREMVTLDHDARRAPVAATDRALLEQVRAARARELGRGSD